MGKIGAVDVVLRVGWLGYFKLGLVALVVELLVYLGASKGLLERISRLLLKRMAKKGGLGGRELLCMVDRIGGKATLDTGTCQVLELIYLLADLFSNFVREVLYFQFDGNRLSSGSLLQSFLCLCGDCVHAFGDFGTLTRTFRGGCLL